MAVADNHAVSGFRKNKFRSNYVCLLHLMYPWDAFQSMWSLKCGSEASHLTAATDNCSTSIKRKMSRDDVGVSGNIS